MFAAEEISQVTAGLILFVGVACFIGLAITYAAFGKKDDAVNYAKHMEQVERDRRIEAEKELEKLKEQKDKPT